MRSVCQSAFNHRFEGLSPGPKGQAIPLTFAKSDFAGLANHRVSIAAFYVQFQTLQLRGMPAVTTLIQGKLLSHAASGAPIIGHARRARAFKGAICNEIA